MKLLQHIESYLPHRSHGPAHWLHSAWPWRSRRSSWFGSRSMPWQSHGLSSWKSASPSLPAWASGSALSRKWRSLMPHGGVSALPHQVAAATSGLIHRERPKSVSSGSVAVIAVAVFAAYSYCLSRRA